MAREKTKAQEEKNHGTQELPYEMYPTKMPKYFTSFQTHWHEELEIACARVGRGLYHVDGQTYLLSEGDIIIIPAKSLHSIEQYNDELYEGLTLIFHSNMVSGTVTDACTAKFIQPLFSNEYHLPIYLDHRLQDTEWLCKLLVECWETDKTRETGFELHMRSLMLQFIEYFYRNHMVNKEVEIKKSDHLADKVRVATDYMMNHYEEKISLDELAELTGMSAYYFGHVFKDYTGQSMVEYLNELRLVIAANRIASEGTQILDIALGCGFQNVSYFNRVFKKTYNMTPKEYRRKNSK